MSNRLLVKTGLVLSAIMSFWSTVVNSAPLHKDVLRILFIGNSYTFVNDLPKMLAVLSKYEDTPIVDEQITEGGATLKQHWLKGKAVQAIQSGQWDYVVLQEQSTLGPTQTQNGVLPIHSPEDFYHYARLFDAQIKQAKARTIFYLTWARKNAPQNQAILNRAYLTTAWDLNAIVAPVGVAWARVQAETSKIALYQSDQSHPTAKGTYLAACIFYATIYNKKPSNIPFDDIIRNIGIDAAEASYLHEVAWQTVSEFPPLTPELYMPFVKMNN